MTDVDAALPPAPGFREVQRFRHPLILAVGVILVGILGWGFVQQVLLGHPWGSRPAPDWVLMVSLLLPLVVFGGVVFVLRLETETSAEALVARYRPFRTRHMPYADLRHAEAITYRPIRDYGGWGFRYARKRGWAWNVSGNRGVRLGLANGATFLLGSQRAEELVDVLRAHGVPSPERADD